MEGVPSRAVSDDGHARLRAARGRPPLFTLEQRRQITAIATCAPGDHGLSLSRWSLRKLADFLAAEGVVSDISHEGLRLLLRQERVVLGQHRDLADLHEVVGHSGQHVVQFYESEHNLAVAAGGFLGAGLAAGQTALVVAAAHHRASFEAELASAGIDLASARACGRYRSLDAEELLATFMVDGEPDGERFDASVGALVRELTASGTPLRVYGEMVALLWEQGAVTAAMTLEELWNDLGRGSAFELFCAYPSSSLDGSADHHRSLCESHSAVVPEPRPLPVRPRELTRRFEPTPFAASVARRFVADAMHAWGHHHAVDATELVVSELVGNAVRYGQRRFRVTVAQLPDGIRVAVTDTSEEPPVLRPQDHEATGGRGLHLIDALSRRWGTHLFDGGKTVWAEIASTQRAGRPTRAASTG